jgi:Ca2+-binding EF-hand superfamily protein
MVQGGARSRAGDPNA